MNQTYKSLLFLSETVDIVCLAGCAQQAQQSAHLAEGLNFITSLEALVPLKSLGLDSQRVKKLALKLHAHSVHYADKLVQTRRSLEHSPHLQTNQERSAGLSARNPPDPH